MYVPPEEYDAQEIWSSVEYGHGNLRKMEFVSSSEYSKLKAAVILTLEENSHLCDGETCTLKLLKDAVGFD